MTVKLTEELIHGEKRLCLYIDNKFIRLWDNTPANILYTNELIHNHRKLVELLEDTSPKTLQEITY